MHVYVLYWYVWYRYMCYVHMCIICMCAVCICVLYADMYCIICTCVLYAYMCVACIYVCYMYVRMHVLYAYVYVQICSAVSALAGSPEEDTEHSTLSVFALFPWTSLSSSLELSQGPAIPQGSERLWSTPWIPPVSQMTDIGVLPLSGVGRHYHHPSPPGSVCILSLSLKLQFISASLVAPGWKIKVGPRQARSTNTYICSLPAPSWRFTTLSGSPMEASLDTREASQFNGRNSKPGAPALRVVHRTDLYHVNGNSNTAVGTLPETQGHAKCII